MNQPHANYQRLLARAKSLPAVPTAVGPPPTCKPL